MPGPFPVIWLFVCFNVLFLAAFIYRRAAGSKPMGKPTAFMLQTTFVAVNCLILFQDELQRYLNWLMRSY